MRFADQVLVNQAIAGDPCGLEFAYSLSSGESFTFTVHAVYLPRQRPEIAGPQGVQATFDWQAAPRSGACAPRRWSTTSKNIRARHRPRGQIYVLLLSGASPASYASQAWMSFLIVYI